MYQWVWVLKENVKFANCINIICKFPNGIYVCNGFCNDICIINIDINLDAENVILTKFCTLLFVCIPSLILIRNKLSTHDTYACR